VKLAVYGKAASGNPQLAVISPSPSQARQESAANWVRPHDSTFTLTGFLIPTIIDTLQEKDYHYEDVWPEDVITKATAALIVSEAWSPAGVAVAMS